MAPPRDEKLLPLPNSVLSHDEILFFFFFCNSSGFLASDCSAQRIEQQETGLALSTLHRTKSSDLIESCHQCSAECLRHPDIPGNNITLVRQDIQDSQAVRISQDNTLHQFWECISFAVHFGISCLAVIMVTRSPRFLFCWNTTSDYEFVSP